MKHSPEQILVCGAETLAEYLHPLGFTFELIQRGKGSGGNFAHGYFINGDRKIDLHYRYSLGLISYSCDGNNLTHEEYIDLLGKHGQNKYPNFSDDPMDAFNCLLYDLKELLNDFTENNAALFKQFKRTD